MQALFLNKYNCSCSLLQPAKYRYYSKQLWLVFISNLKSSIIVLLIVFEGIAFHKQSTRYSVKCMPLLVYSWHRQNFWLHHLLQRTPCLISNPFMLISSIYFPYESHSGKRALKSWLKNVILDKPVHFTQAIRDNTSAFW